MPTVKCDKCGHSVEVEDATKRYKLPLFFIFLGLAILTYEHTVNNPSLIIIILGGLCQLLVLSGWLWQGFVLVGIDDKLLKKRFDISTKIVNLA